MMQKTWKTFLNGLATSLPIALTVYFIYWLVASIESLTKPFIMLLISENMYFAGMGFVFGILLLFAIGLMVNAWVGQKLIELGESFLDRIPLVKSIYAAIKDFLNFFSTAKKEDGLKQVVLVPIGAAKLIGFVTADSLNFLPDTEDMVAVFLPMSYQMGGYTAYIKKDKIEKIDMSIEDAMRLVLTANLAKPKSN